MKFVLMCGGQGTKLWPVSKDNFPKQFNNILGDKSLFQINVEQLLTKYNPNDIYVSTSENYIDFVATQAPMLPKKNYIIEPHLKKMNGPSCCLSMLYLLKDFPDEPVMFYVQPVIIRKPTEKYILMIETYEALVRKHNKIVTGGKYPLYPEVGSDYQELGAQIENDNGLEVFQSKRFVPRPKTLEEAKVMLSKSKLALHCNHLTGTPRKFFDELKEYRKDWYDISMEMKEVIGKKSTYNDILEVYSKYEPGNVEMFTKFLYDAGKMQIVILPFDWTHITTWNDVYEYLKKEKVELKNGTKITVDSQDNLIINKTSKLIGAIGIHNMVVVQTEEALLICPKNDTGRLKELLDEIERAGLKQFL